MKLKATDKNISLIFRVNREINNSIKYTPDMEQFGKPEDWRVVTNNKDDCDGYALTKYMKLRSEGIPEECMAVCTCITETGGGHAVLVVSTDIGDFVLDNRYPDARAYDTLPYKWSYVPDNVTGKN